MGDRSNGYEAIASWWFTGRKHTISSRKVLDWASDLPPGSTVLDLGCGDGFPMSMALAEAGFHLFGIDASPTMVAGFRRNVPEAVVECSAVEDSTLFGRRFEGVLAWGLIFLLAPEVQRSVIERVSQALALGGLFLFTAPRQTCEWIDAATGSSSTSLGQAEYTRILDSNNLQVTGEAIDEGGNYYYLSRKPLTS